jgi:hypothetical protein
MYFTPTTRVSNRRTNLLQYLSLVVKEHTQQSKNIQKYKLAVRHSSQMQSTGISSSDIEEAIYPTDKTY